MRHEEQKPETPDVRFQITGQGPLVYMVPQSLKAVADLSLIFMAAAHGHWLAAGLQSVRDRLDTREGVLARCGLFAVTFVLIVVSPLSVIMMIIKLLASALRGCSGGGDTASIPPFAATADPEASSTVALPGTLVHSVPMSQVDPSYSAPSSGPRLDSNTDSTPGRRRVPGRPRADASPSGAPHSTHSASASHGRAPSDVEAFPAAPATPGSNQGPRRRRNSASTPTRESAPRPGPHQTGASSRPSVTPNPSSSSRAGQGHFPPPRAGAAPTPPHAEPHPSSSRQPDASPRLRTAKTPSQSQQEQAAHELPPDSRPSVSQPSTLRTPTPSADSSVPSTPPPPSSESQPASRAPSPQVPQPPAMPITASVSTPDTSDTSSSGWAPSAPAPVSESPRSLQPPPRHRPQVSLLSEGRGTSPTSPSVSGPRTAAPRARAEHRTPETTTTRPALPEFVERPSVTDSPPSLPPPPDPPTSPAQRPPSSGPESPSGSRSC